MALKKVIKSKGDRVSEIHRRQKEINEQIRELSSEYRRLDEEYLSIQIAPFKLGGYALAEISSGRTKKWQKCLLECENGTLYVRPIKEDGELSGRHFSIIPCGDQEYSYFLKEVE